MSETPDALVLLAHGSPDPAWLAPIEATAGRIRRALPASCPVVLATLEHGPSLEQAVHSLQAAGHRRVAVVPLFLSDGGRHLRRDIPALVSALQHSFTSVELVVVPPLGVDAAVQDALAAAAVRLAGLDATSS